MKFSLTKYGWRCVLGAEVAYVICLLGGFLPLRNARAVELHHSLFETLPGFTWINFGSFVLGAVYMFVFSWIFAWYMVWMLNSSIKH
ncbi:MAG: hypothetical protein AAB588_06335 [Patescibacteria group bacterium]